MVTITNDLIVAGVSGAGGWNRKQLEILGVAWPPRRGWKWAVIGKQITEEQYQEFIERTGITRRVDRKNAKDARLLKRIAGE